MLTLFKLTSTWKRTWLEKKKDESPTSLEKTHLVCEEIVDLLPFPIKRQNNDNGKLYIIMRCVFFFYDYFSIA